MIHLFSSHTYLPTILKYTALKFDTLKPGKPVFWLNVFKEASTSILGYLPEILMTNRFNLKKQGW